MLKCRVASSFFGNYRCQSNSKRKISFTSFTISVVRLEIILLLCFLSGTETEQLQLQLQLQSQLQLQLQN